MDEIDTEDILETVEIAPVSYTPTPSLYEIMEAIESTPTQSLPLKDE